MNMAFLAKLGWRLVNEGTSLWARVFGGKYMKNIPLVDLYKRVNDFWVLNEGWNWDMLEGLLPAHVEDRITALTLSENISNQNGLCWGVSESGSFTVSTTQDIAAFDEVRVGKNAWKLMVPNRIRT